MISNAFQSGPLEKTDSTIILENLLQNLLSPDFKNTFSIEQGELALLQKSLIDHSEKKHNITLLLRFSNFSHLDFFTEQEGHFYINKMQEIMHKRNQSDFDTFFNTSESKEENETKHISSQAERLALNFYTSTFNINPVLRTELNRLAQSSQQNNSYFQDECFLLLTSAALTQHFLQREQNALRPEQPAQGLRIEIFRSEAPLFEDFRNMDDLLFHSTTRHSKGFTSYSQDKLALSDPGQTIEYQENKGTIPVFHAKDDLHILIHKTNLHAKNLSSFSHIQGEDEMLAEESAKETTLTHKAGNILLLKTNHVRPVNAAPDDNYMLELALRFAYENYLQFPYPEPYANDPDCTLELKTYTGTSVVINRPNHGLAHAARQARLVEDLLPLFAAHSKTKELKDFANTIMQNPYMMHLIQIAAVFLTVGRIHELRSLEDPDGHKMARQNSRDAFEKFASIYYSANLNNINTKKLATIKELIHTCSDAIFYLAPTVSNHFTTPKQKVIATLLTTAHTMDTPRVPGLWEIQKESEPELAKKMVHDLLFYNGNKDKNLDGILNINNNEKIDIILDSLWNNAIDYLKETGDRIPSEDITKNIDYNRFLFTQCSLNPSYVSDILQLSKPSPVLVRESKISEENDKLYFDTLFYILNNSDNKDQQLNILASEPEFSDLIFYANQYLQTNPYPEENEIVRQIQSISHLESFQEARKNYHPNPVTATSFGEKIQNLPRHLKAMIPYLRKSNLVNEETIHQLKDFYQKNLAAAYNLVEGTRDLALKDQLNADTLDALFTVTTIHHHVIEDILFYLYPYIAHDTSSSIYAKLTRAFIKNNKFELLKMQKVTQNIFDASLGNLEAIQERFSKTPDPSKIPQMIYALGYGCFRHAALFGHTPVMKYLFDLSNNDTNMLNSDGDYLLFHHAAQNGRLDVLQYLFECTTERQRNEILSKNTLILAAIKYNHLTIIQYIFSIASEFQKENMTAENYHIAFRMAAAYGALNIMKYLFAAASLDMQEEMIEAQQFEVLREKSYFSTAEQRVWLMEKARHFFMHEIDSTTGYGLAYPYVAEELAMLHEKFDAHKRNFPDVTFDLTNDEDKKVYFYVLCNYVHNKAFNDPKEIYFLIQLPAIKELLLIVLGHHPERKLLEKGIRPADDSIALLRDHPDIKKLAPQTFSSVHSALLNHSLLKSADFNPQTDRSDPEVTIRLPKKNPGKSTH